MIIAIVFFFYSEGATITATLVIGFTTILIMVTHFLGSKAKGQLVIHDIISAFAYFLNCSIAVISAFFMARSLATKTLNDLILSLFISLAILLGIRTWSKTIFNSKYKFRSGVILVFPFFCNAPLVLIYSALGLSNFLPWATVILIELGLVGILTILWQTGQEKERKARNPLQGVLNSYVPNPMLSVTRRRWRFFTFPKL
jgi:hypothetical protein